MSDKTYCIKHYRQTFPNKGCDMCEQDRSIADLKVMRQELEDANIAGAFRCVELQERIATLEAENTTLKSRNALLQGVFDHSEALLIKHGYLKEQGE